jgi:dTMP kinase
MPPRGSFIAIEGIDGAGKHTQIAMLTRALAANGIPYATISFPRYTSFFGRLVAQYLNGDFGQLGAVDAHFSSLLYAGDRLESKPEIEAALASGKLLMADRYVSSNLAHQGARVSAADREAFLAWLRQLEYQTYGLPAEDLVLYLRLPPAEAQRRVSKKATRQYTARNRDIHEANLDHLEEAARVYDSLAAQPHWVTIECLNPQTGARRSPVEIHAQVWQAVEGFLERSRRVQNANA